MAGDGLVETLFVDLIALGSLDIGIVFDSCPKVVPDMCLAKLALNIPVLTLSKNGLSAGRHAVMTDNVECTCVAIPKGMLWNDGSL